MRVQGDPSLTSLLTAREGFGAWGTKQEEMQEAFSQWLSRSIIGSN